MHEGLQHGHEAVLVHAQDRHHHLARRSEIPLDATHLCEGKRNAKRNLPEHLSM